MLRAAPYFDYGNSNILQLPASGRVVVKAKVFLFVCLFCSGLRNCKNLLTVCELRKMIQTSVIMNWDKIKGVLNGQIKIIL